MKGKNSFRFNGLVHKKSVGVDLTSDKKGLVLSTQKRTGTYISSHSGDCSSLEVTSVELEFTVIRRLNDLVVAILIHLKIKLKYLLMSEHSRRRSLKVLMPIFTNSFALELTTCQLS